MGPPAGYGCLVDEPTPAQLRRCVLAASVLHDVDAEPRDDGVLLPGRPPVAVRLAELRLALGGADPDSPAARDRVACWLLGRRRLADHDAPALRDRLRPLGLPVDHVLHPGEEWVELHVLGAAMDVGLGLLGLRTDAPEEVGPLPRALLRAAGVDPADHWPAAAAYLEEMGSVAAQRFCRAPAAPLRPMGDSDVVTLLASRALRTALVADAGGMRAAAVPMRGRGWLDLSRIDPAFAVAAAAATPAEQRGFARPLLLTRDEVTLTLPGGRPQEIVLRDPAPPEPWLRDVLYHR